MDGSTLAVAIGVIKNMSQSAAARAETAKQAAEDAQLAAEAAQLAAEAARDEAVEHSIGASVQGTKLIITPISEGGGS